MAVLVLILNSSESIDSLDNKLLVSLGSKNKKNNRFDIW